MQPVSANPSACVSAAPLPNPCDSPRARTEGSTVQPYSVSNAGVVHAGAAPPPPLKTTQALANEARECCIRDGLPAAMTWLEQTPAARSGASHAAVLQAIVLALGNDAQWSCSRQHSVMHKVGMPSQQVNAHHRALRSLQQAVAQAKPNDLAGLQSFSRRCDALLTRWPLAFVDNRELSLRVVRCMQWQATAFHHIADEVKAGRTDNVRPLWHAYALGAADGGGRGQGVRVWKLLIIGESVCSPLYSHRVAPTPDEYAGVAFEELRAGVPVETLLTRYPLEHPVLQRWMREQAEPFQRSMPRRSLPSIDWRAVMPGATAAHHGDALQ